MKMITVTEASRNFSDVISRVHYQGESALLVNGGRQLAALWPDIAHLSPTDAASLGRDIGESRRSLPPLKSKWE